VRWNVKFTNEAEGWFLTLDAGDRGRVVAAIKLLELKGPALGRPLADSVKGSRHHNMKELRPRGGHLRALFVFDPRRAAIILLGGDKAGNWNGWYRYNIPRADALYDEYLRELERKGLI
jgi:hypothetical protein